MSAISDRYDRDARLYERWWAPVLAPAAAALLDRCEPWVSAAMRLWGALRLLDVGTGTGALAIDAAARWPEAEIMGVDASRGMVAIARRRAAETLDDGASRIRWQRAEAGALPIPDASVDLVVSSFVYQLVPDRPAAFRDALRVLRPGGRLAIVTWIDRHDGFVPAVEFDEAVYDLEIDEDEYEEEQRAGDFRSARTAERELRGAGFRRVKAEVEHLDQPWTLDTYLDYKVEYDERTLFEDLDDATGRRLRARVRERLIALEAEAFRWRPPIVYARGERPA